MSIESELPSEEAARRKSGRGRSFKGAGFSRDSDEAQALIALDVFSQP